MVTDAAATRVGGPARPISLAVSAVLVVATLVCASAIVRFLLALAHPTPIFFADEYIYSTLAHELATTGRATIRGEAAGFPALLEPILTAPFWLFGDAGIALRLTQALNAIAMSLAAVPVFVLARRLGLTSRWAVATAAFALVVPDLFYVAYVLGEPIAYPLVLGAVCAGVYALDEPTRRNQLAFVALAALASFARIQFVVLPLAFFVAALVIRTGIRRLRLSLGLFALAALPVAIKGLGYYAVVTDVPLAPGELIRWAGVDAMLLAYAAGWLVVPGALVALATPRGRTERAFAAMTAFLAAGLFFEAALYASNAGDDQAGRFQERYLFTLLPLVAIAFALSLARGGRARWAVAILGSLLVAVSARYPLSGWTDEHGRQDSPFLMGVFRLEEAIGHANGSLLVAVVVAGLAAGAAAVAFRPRFAGPAFAAVGVALAAVGLGAWSLDARYSQNERETYFPADARWVDRAGLADVTIVNTSGAARARPLEQMFWNRSITRLVRLRGGGRPDLFAAPRVQIGGDGRLLVDGRTLRTPLLVTEYGITADFRGATSVASTPLFELWKPQGTPRLRLLAGGRYYDGWLAGSGSVRVWDSPGTLVLRLSLPQHAPAARLVFRAPGVRRVVAVAPGQSRRVAFRVSSGAWTLLWNGPSNYLPDMRPVSVRADELQLVR
jgi:hypothetical protein